MIPWIMKVSVFGSSAQIYLLWGGEQDSNQKNRGRKTVV